MTEPDMEPIDPGRIPGLLELMFGGYAPLIHQALSVPHPVNQWAYLPPEDTND